VSDYGVTLPQTEDSRSPREKVLETTEILEIILSFLPLESLLTCRQLSNRVKDDIDGSLLLRETMFLRPTRVPREAWRLDPEIDGSGEGITSVRPVAGMIPLPGIATGYMQALQPTPHMIRTPAILNPIFPNRRYRAPHLFDSRDQCDCVLTSDIVRHIGKGNTDRQDRILDMYLTQPPCRQAWVTASFIVPQGPSNPSEIDFLRCGGLLELGGGITMRDLLKTASTVRGLVSVYRMAPKPPRKKNKRWSYTNWEPRKHKKRPPRGHLPPEITHNATLFEVLQSLGIEDAPSANEVQAGGECWLLDTIVPTDEVRAGVAPYTEDTTQ
jgi:hypothetical protein